MRIRAELLTQRQCSENEDCLFAMRPARNRYFIEVLYYRLDCTNVELPC